eukprot:gene24336-32775_t
MSRPLSLYNDAIPATAETADTALKEAKTSLSSLTLLDGAKQVAENLTTSLINQKNAPLLMMAKTGKERSCILSYVRSSNEVMLERLKLLQVEADQLVEEGMSYTISLLLEIVNKYRLQAQVDRFGCGFAPWQVHPVHFIVFTDSKYCGKDAIWKIDVKVPDKKGGGVHINDFIKSDTKSNFQPSADLVKFTGRTGGDVFVCKNLDEALEFAKDLLQRISPVSSEQSVVVKLALDRSQKEGAFNTESSSSKSAIVLEDGQKQRILYCDLRPATTAAVTSMQWPIPEGFDLTYNHNSTDLTTPLAHPAVRKPGWSKLYRESYCDTPDSVHCVDPEKRSLNVCRTANPTLHLCRAGNSTASVFMRTCEELNITVDKYILTLALFYQGKRSSPFFNNLLYKVASGAKDGCVVVYIKGKNNSDSNYTTVSGNPLSFPCGTCGFIQPRTPRTGDGTSKANAQVELVLLPYNFHILFPLLLMGLSIKEYMSSEKIRVWRHNINVYLQSTPAYYHVPLWQLLSQLDLIQLAALPPVAAIANKVNMAMQHIHNMVKLLEQNCLVDLIAIDSVTKYEGYNYEGLTTVMISRPVPITALQTPVERELELIPPSLLQIHSNDLLFSWEHMRKHIYGGAGKTVRGIFFGSDQPQVDSTYKPAAFSSTNWFSKAVGGSSYPQKSSAAMGNYVNVLARKEGLRDPLIPDVPPTKDENHPSEILRRKVNVNFGSRYRKEGSGKELADLPDDEKSLALDQFIEKTSSMDASTSSDSNGSNSGGIAMMDDQSDSSSAALISALRETANLYCDSPFPASFSNMLDDDFLAVPISENQPPTEAILTTFENVAGAAKYEIPFIQRPPSRRVSKRKQQELSQEQRPLQENQPVNTADDSLPADEDTSIMVTEENQRKKSHLSNVGEPPNEFQFDDLVVEMEVEDDEDDDDSNSNFGGCNDVENLNLGPSESIAPASIDNGNTYVYTNNSYYAEDDQPGVYNESPSVSGQRIAAPALISYPNAPKVFAHQGLTPIVVPSRGDRYPSILNPTKPNPHEIHGKVHPIPGIPSSSSSSTPVVHSISSATSTSLSSPSPSPMPSLLESSDEKLPPGWVKCISKREGRVYWFNSHTGQSSWTLPR